MRLIESPGVVVIGGGSAGHAAASEAARLGIKTVLVEDAEPLGGLCILRGCMPSKTLIETANRMRDIRQAARFGIRGATAEVDGAALRDRVKNLTNEFRAVREEEMTSGEYEIVRGKARFVSPAELEVEGWGRLKAPAFIVATGSRPSVPDLPGLAGTPYWTSDDVVRLPFLPNHLVVVGAGAIGMECAHLFEGLGSQVTIVARGSSIMNGMDRDLAAALEAESADRGITFLKNSPIARVEHADGRFRLHLEAQGAILEADALLFATGRSPVTGDLGLENTGVAMHEGRISIDEQAAASVPGFFAAGDCASPVAVVHLAVIQGTVAATNAVRFLRRDKRSAPALWNPGSSMKAWFTEPQCVQIGISAGEAEEKNIAIIQGRQDYADHGKGMIAGARHGFVNVIVDRENGRILGASGVGPQVVETAHLMQAAIELKLTAAQYLAIPHYHPTFAEAWSWAVEKAAASIPSRPPVARPARSS